MAGETYSYDSNGRALPEVPASVVNLPYTCTLPHKILIAINWPRTIKRAGRVWRFTGKTGEWSKSGIPSAEYRAVGGDGEGDDRVWLSANGEIAPD